MDDSIEGLVHFDMDVDVAVEPYCYLEEGDPWAVASACREAALAFVNGVGSGWTKRDLARWLLGPYRDAACPLPGAERVGFAPTMVDVDPVRLDRLLHDVREHALRSLQGSPDGLVSLPAWARTAGSILRSRHGNGEHGYIPVDWPRMRLDDRVMSLFAVDVLVRPRDYERRLAVCTRCRAVSFDEAARERGFCDLHPDRVRYESGILPRAGEAERAAVAESRRRR